ncbi:MAG: hypothetical protein AAGA86_15025, partial [Bacteroidota bacterium]
PFDPNDAYNDRGQNNHRLPMAYIDIDEDASTFSSSSANLNAPSYSRVIYAGLYWAIFFMPWIQRIRKICN